MNAQLSELLARKGAAVHALDPSATVIDAVALMNTERIGAVVVCHGTRALGIFTERDVMRRVVAERRDPHRTRLQNVMTHPLVVVEESLTVGQAMAMCSERRFRHLPVVRRGRIIGLISTGDLHKWLVEDQTRRIHELNDYVWGPAGIDDRPQPYHPARPYVPRR